MPITGSEPLTSSVPTTASMAGYGFPRTFYVAGNDEELDAASICVSALYGVSEESCLRILRYLEARFEARSEKSRR